VTQNDKTRRPVPAVPLAGQAALAALAATTLLTATVGVCNTGGLPGTEVVLLYSRDPRGGSGGVPGGRVEGEVGTLIIVELGSLVFFGKHNRCAVGSNNSAKNHGTPTNKVSLQNKLGAGNKMVMSEMTRGVNMMGLLLFKIK
jgi:hypothetical protein